MVKQFWSHVKRGPKEKCWFWNQKDTGNYGRFSYKGTAYVAHRVSYTLENGKIPPGLCVLHACDNRSCVNPLHLFVGTHQDNTDDMMSKGRGKHKKVKLHHVETVVAPEEHEIIVQLLKEGFHHTKIGRKFRIDPMVIEIIAKVEGIEVW